MPGLQRTGSAWQYKNQYNTNSAGIKMLKMSLQMTLESSSACYCSKRLRKRVPNGRSRDTERSLPELSPGSGYNEVLQLLYLLCQFLSPDLFSTCSLVAVYFHGPTVSTVVLVWQCRMSSLLLSMCPRQFHFLLLSWVSTSSSSVCLHGSLLAICPANVCLQTYVNIC